MFSNRRVPSDVQLDQRALAARRRAQPPIRNDCSCGCDELTADVEPSSATESLAIALGSMSIHERFDLAKLPAEMRGMSITARANAIIRSHTIAIANRSMRWEAEC